MVFTYAIIQISPIVQLVLSALVAVACAAPHHSGASVSSWGHHETSLPIVYDAAEVVVAAQPEYAHVGSIVNHVPTAVSHQSRTDYHSEPIVKSVLAPIEYVQPIVHQHIAQPIVHHQQIVEPTLVYASSPIAHHQPIVHHQQISPVVYSSQPLLHAAHHQLVQAW